MFAVGMNGMNGSNYFRKSLHSLVSSKQSELLRSLHCSHSLREDLNQQDKVIKTQITGWSVITEKARFLNQNTTDN